MTAKAMLPRRSPRMCVISATNRSLERWKSSAKTPIAPSAHDVYEITCRSGRVGNYKFVPVDGVRLNLSGIHISAPHIVGKSVLTLSFEWSDIDEVMLFMGDILSIIFLSVYPEASTRVMRQFNITDPTVDFRFDRQSEDPTHQLVTLFPQNLRGDWAPAFQQFLGESKVRNLDVKLANEVLVLSSPKTFIAVAVETEATLGPVHEVVPVSPAPNAEGDGPRQESRTPASAARRPNPRFPTPAHHLINASEWERTVCDFKANEMCPSPVSVSLKSYCCLQDGTFLNDEVIEFYLRWLQETKMTEDDRRRSYFFSTQFYSRLTQNGRYDDHSALPAERRYKRIKRWTKKVDIFEKDFLFVPINRGPHWFLAVICYPGLAGPQRMDNDEPLETSVLDEAKHENGRARSLSVFSDSGSLDSLAMEDELGMLDEASASREDMIDEDYGSAGRTPPWLARNEETGDGVGSERREETLDSEMSDAEAILDTPQVQQNASKREKQPGNPDIKIKQPCILILDSLRSAYLRARVVVTLRDYLACELREKKGETREFNRITMKGHCPRVPQQPNSSDCGAFMLQYVESFFENPIEGFSLPIVNLGDWFPVDEMQWKRGRIAQIIRDMAAQQRPGVGLSFPRLNVGSGMGYVKREPRSVEEE